MPTPNLDPQELSKFDAQAANWWDPRGPLRTLHAINPVRLRYIDRAVALDGKTVLDVGCGGGLLCEAMARQNAAVTGLDASSTAIRAAEQHRDAGGMAIEYRIGTVAEFADREARRFDAVTCMELLEHVPEPWGLVASCACLLKPGGHLVFATINRTARAYFAAILGAEYLLHILPRGTHDYARFIRPSELSRWLRRAGCNVVDISGVRYIPWLNRCALGGNPTVNYLLHARLRD